MTTMTERQMQDEWVANVVALGNSIHGGAAPSIADAAWSAPGLFRERMLAEFQVGVHAVVDLLLDARQGESVRAAFDAGLAQGFFGEESAISRGLRGRSESLRKVEIEEAGESRNTVSAIRDIGVNFGGRIRYG
ncbi:hypothetical protein [Burkholderia pyrrocinia]|uniref:hypothetical protein n=1 Tax=Burkholderia pyrrocinia TaxID=60550 RepID=UPI001BD09B1D|nr:hypothetical protein [Burkholderia pyrrocinia]QVN21291.1 hypothetical protein JYG32_32750 [Burkholderia pyrrocinia]